VHRVAVIVPTCMPHPERFGRTLAGLRAQTLPAAEWEVVVVDNTPHPPLDAAAVTRLAPNFRVVREPQPGLTFARRAGLRATSAPLIVFADDDNVLAPEYLAHVVRLFATHDRIGALGGKSVPEFEQPPAPWQVEFFTLLALRDLGAAPICSNGLRAPGAARNAYPAAAPLGAGLALRRAAVEGWLADAGGSSLPDRRGGELTSGGDNDIVFCVMASGWEVGYFPELVLTHLIPAGRLNPAYLGRLNRGIQESWMRVLAKHDANPWPPIAGWTLPLRQAKAWFTHRAWAGPAERVRWQGACGHFAGRVGGPKNS
jgi:glycosyltransferase involved in cell wall biosynthesis